MSYNVQLRCLFLPLLTSSLQPQTYDPLRPVHRMAVTIYPG